MSDDGSPEEDMNEKVLRIGGSAMLITSVMVSASIALGRNQIAQRSGKGKEALDFQKMNEASQMATRALRRATMYNIIGFGGLITFGCWYHNIRSFQDFRTTVQSIKGVQISKEGAVPTKWEDIFPEDVMKGGKQSVPNISEEVPKKND